MRRIKTILGAIAVMAAMLVVFAAPAMADDFFSSDFEQEAESGDVDQSFEVTSEGDNSNQTAGIQGVANTGNTQNQIGVFDAGTGFDGNDFFFDDDLDEFCDDFDGDDFCDFDFFFDDDFDFFFDDDFDFGDDGFGDFEFDEVGSSIEVSPTNVTSSDQEVNQAATASG